MATKKRAKKPAPRKPARRPARRKEQTWPAPTPQAMSPERERLLQQQPRSGFEPLTLVLGITILVLLGLSIRAVLKQCKQPCPATAQSQMEARRPIEGGAGPAAVPATDRMAKAANRAAAGAPSAPAARVAAFPMTFKLSQSGEELAEVAVFPKKGRVMRLIKPETITAGKVSLVWDGKDSAGKPLAPGVYYLRLRDAKGERVEELKVP